MNHPAAAPFRIGSLELRNRLVVSAHGLATVTEGVPGELDARYWSRLSRGGAGLLIAGGTQVSADSVLRNRILTEAYAERAMSGLRSRAEAMRSGGAVAGIQLGHLGRETLGAGTFLPFVAPSPVRGPREPAAAHTLDDREITRIVEDFRLSARHCAEAGFQVIEIHAAHGYLLAQFLSPFANIRTDRYGAGVPGRARALAEVVQAVREGAGDQVVVGVRVSTEGDGPAHLNLTHLAELLPHVSAEAPFDYLNLTWGDRGRYVPDMATERPPLLGRTAELRAVVRVPLMLCSAFRDPGDIAAALSSGAADLVGSARAHIADPDFARKVLEGRGGEIRPCTACLQDCRTYEPTGLCVVNPDLAPAGEQRRPARPLLLTDSRRASGGGLLVVGAGPAGLECAVTAAERGVRVTLVERAQEIGGQLRIAGAAPNRSGWLELIGYYQRRIDALGIELRLGEPVSVADVEAAGEVVWAIGAEEAAPPVADAVRSGDVTPELFDGAESVLVVDDGFGWWQAIGAVEAALESDVDSVVLATPGAGFATSIPAESRTQFLERHRGGPLEVRVLHRLVAVKPLARLENLLDGRLTELAADVVVQVGERFARPVPVACGTAATAIGDCVAPRQVSHAIAEGRAAGLSSAGTPRCT
ncbi:FAD-binding protein [Amycolatopsis acidicola]|uniref:FAD-binding protein n=1 Tax=Amycolatopsis acidicola TaxID=2596893 RepID=A0A5N0UKA5_9PSEU|nr:FAD-binding protein [Amycolatopsis acidicola]KAA9149859.1 FAD-binding protein [Amycolatopsis acidicola]